MSTVGDNRTIWDNATSYAVRSRHGITGPATRDGMIGATVVCNFDELIVRAIWTTDAEFRND